MVRLALLFLANLVLISPGHTAGESESGEISVQQEQNGDEAAAPRKTMEGLAELGLNIGIRALKESGKLYPFAKLAYETEDGEQMKTLGKKRGEEIEPPDEWTAQLYKAVRKTTTDNRLKAASIVRLHKAKDKNGDKVRGLWALVDHREHPAMIFFVPLLEQEDGDHKPGKLVYRGTDQTLFPEAPSDGSSADEG
jgi:hypothetical protein